MHGEFCTTSAVCERWKMCCGAENKPNITNKPETEPKGEAHMLVIRAAVGRVRKQTGPGTDMMMILLSVGLDVVHLILH